MSAHPIQSIVAVMLLSLLAFAASGLTGPGPAPVTRLACSGEPVCGG